MATTTISGQFIAHVRWLLERSWEYVAKEIAVREGVNGYTDLALPAYVNTVVAVEAYVNEVFLSDFGRLATWGDSPLAAFSAEWFDWIEKVELVAKLTMVPQLAFGATLVHGHQPLQDMKLLVRLRNDLVHYKMPGTPPPYVKDLAQRGIALRRRANYPWVGEREYLRRDSVGSQHGGRDRARRGRADPDRAPRGTGGAARE